MHILLMYIIRINIICNVLYPLHTYHIILCTYMKQRRFLMLFIF